MLRLPTLQPKVRVPGLSWEMVPDSAFVLGAGAHILPIGALGVVATVKQLVTYRLRYLER